MSVIQILFRVDEICKKYEKYDVDKQRERNGTGDDAFTRLYDTVESEIEGAIRVCNINLHNYFSLSFLRCFHSQMEIKKIKRILFHWSANQKKQKSEAVAMESNRAKAVAMNAEIRRTKARLLEEVAKLQKLAYKKVYFYLLIFNIYV